MLDHERREGLSWSLHACMFWPSSQASSPDNSVGMGSNGDNSPSETVSCQCGQSGGRPGPGSSLCVSWFYTTCNHHRDNIFKIIFMYRNLLIFWYMPSIQLTSAEVKWNSLNTPYIGEPLKCSTSLNFHKYSLLRSINNKHISPSVTRHVTAHRGPWGNVGTLY